MLYSNSSKTSYSHLDRFHMMSSWIHVISSIHLMIVLHRTLFVFLPYTACYQTSVFTDQIYFAWNEKSSYLIMFDPDFFDSLLGKP